jgi:hypothetical protein
VRALTGRIPRGLKNHRTPEGFAFGAYVRAKLRRLGALPDDARPLLREAGRLMLDLERLREEQDQALKRRRLTVARRIDRRLVPLRTQFLAIEARLEELAGHREATVEELLRRVGTAAREAAGDGN